MRILIAEDEVTIARALKVMLEKNKYAVDMVHNLSLIHISEPTRHLLQSRMPSSA